MYGEGLEELPRNGEREVQERMEEATKLGELELVMATISKALGFSSNGNLPLQGREREGEPQL